MLLVSFIWSIYIIVRLYYDEFHSWDFWLCPFVDVSETLQLSHKWVQDGPISKTFQLTLALCGDCRRSGITWNSVCWSQLCSSSPWQACIWPTKITGHIRKLALLRWLWWLWCKRKYISNRASRARIKNCIGNLEFCDTWYLLIIHGILNRWLGNLQFCDKKPAIAWLFVHHSFGVQIEFRSDASKRFLHQFTLWHPRFTGHWMFHSRMQSRSHWSCLSQHWSPWQVGEMGVGYHWVSQF